MKFESFLKYKLEEIKKSDLYRRRVIIDKSVINFSSNDYLGLKDNSYTKERLCQNINNLSLGSGASTHVSGYHPIQKELEKFLANFKQTESCIVVGSGYLANVGLISAITTEKDIIFSDELNHASIIDGIRLSKAKKVIYKHNDIEDLEQKLKSAKPEGNIFIITDGVFSMEGDIAPVDKLLALAEKYDAMLIIDDAHGTGVLGEGRGTLFHFGIKPTSRVIQMGTLSKAVGSYGAFICGSKLLVEYLENTMRTAIFTTGLSPIQNFISLENLKIIQKEPHRGKEAIEKATYVAENLKDMGFNVKHFGTPIISLITGGAKKALEYRDFLLRHKIFIQAIRPPTVPQGTSRLRITVNYNHSKIDIDYLLETFKKLKGAT